MIVALAALFFVFGAVVSMSLLGSDGPFGADLTNTLATLVAAFVGAWAAFELQTRDKAAEDRRRRVAAGNRALFVLLQQVSTLKLFQKDTLDPVRDKPGRMIEMQPLLPYEVDHLSFDLKDLEFFLATPKYQQILVDLSLEEARFKEAIKTINMRSKVHSEHVQPTLAGAGIRSGAAYSSEDFKAALGGYLYPLLESLTEAVIFHVDRTVLSLIDMKKRLREALKEQFPKERFLDFELLNEPQQAVPAALDDML